MTQGQGSSAIAIDGDELSGADQSQDATVDNSTEQSAGADVYNDQFFEHQRPDLGRPRQGPRQVREQGRATAATAGSVSQSNDATNSAKAGNSNDTVQEVTQAQAVGGADTGGDDKGGYDKDGDDKGNHEGAGQDQTATVGNETRAVGRGQRSTTSSRTSRAGVTVGGSGGGGSVWQSNDATNTAAALQQQRDERKPSSRARPGRPGRHRRKRLTSPMPQTSRRTPR